MHRMEPVGLPQDATPDVRVLPELSAEQQVNNTDVSESLSPSGCREVLYNAGVISHAHVGRQPSKANEPEMDPELAGLDALESGRPGERPAYPFTTLIRYAIKGSANGRLLLEDIYNAIQTRYPYFETSPSGWKNSVRHTLSLMTCFEKVPRLLTEPGKGSYWTVNDSMPHAKPSRVRIRKRKAPDDDTLPGTPRTLPDALRSEFPGGESPSDSEHRRSSIPYGYPEGSVRRHSSHVRENVHGRSSDHSYNTDKIPHLHYYIDNGSHTERDSPYIIHEREQSEPEHHGSQPCSSSQSEDNRDSVATKGATSPNPTDYRLILVSELERLRDVISTRDDIDNEWCRSMVDRLKDTGLL
ncbi:unnamed protein product [Rhizoctonia solani]|uniref:Fork-head domain-containing protein n=1 Tax=Rhizoctonia solani TaxID=456999 RepID=A0A8H3A6B6_9AGAM|nr:unnamed protein product [Rhizoctonia solani]